MTVDQVMTVMALLSCILLGIDIIRLEHRVRKLEESRQ